MPQLAISSPLEVAVAAMGSAIVLQPASDTSAAAIAAVIFIAIAIHASLWLQDDDSDTPKGTNGRQDR